MRWTSRTAEDPVAHFWSKVDRGAPDACWPWIASLNRGGYGRFKIGGLAWRAHRYAFTVSKGEIPEGQLVRHACDNRRCCNPAHLILGSDADNAADRVSRGRGAPLRGEANHQAKLSAIDVLTIRAALGAGEKLASLAERFGVSTSTIWKIKTGRKWAEGAVRGQPGRRAA